MEGDWWATRGVIAGGGSVLAHLPAALLWRVVPIDELWACSISDDPLVSQLGADELGRFVLLVGGLDGLFLDGRRQIKILLIRIGDKVAEGTELVVRGGGGIVVTAGRRALIALEPALDGVDLARIIVRLATRLLTHVHPRTLAVGRLRLRLRLGVDLLLVLLLALLAAVAIATLLRLAIDESARRRGALLLGRSALRRRRLPCGGRRRLYGRRRLLCGRRRRLCGLGRRRLLERLVDALRHGDERLLRGPLARCGGGSLADEALQLGLLRLPGEGLDGGWARRRRDRRSARGSRRGRGLVASGSGGIGVKRLRLLGLPLHPSLHPRLHLRLHLRLRRCDLGRLVRCGGIDLRSVHLRGPHRRLRLRLRRLSRRLPLHPLPFLLRFGAKLNSLALLSSLPLPLELLSIELLTLKVASARSRVLG